MKRYLLFCGLSYYPSGGWEDFVGSYDTIRECILALIGQYSDWYHIVDTETMQMVSIENEIYQ